jgi:uncharacterized protein YdeI (YjbR/CyaY-like superfamily)
MGRHKEKLDKNELKILSFKTQREFGKWLSKNYTTGGVWLKLFKKGSDVRSITYAEALDEALCCGWIDGQSKSYDDRSWIQKFVPRRPKSTWSKRNISHIERLTSLGKMKPSGLAEVERAKADGRWARAYDPPSEMKIPGDFIKELSKNKKAKAFFESLNKTNKYSIAWRLQTAKKPETRERRMKAILDMLAKEQKFH